MVHFTTSNLTTNIFLLVTSILAFAAWVIAFAGLIALRVTGGSWWIMIFELLLVVGVILLILTGTFLEYRLVILTFLAVSVSYLTSEIGGAIALTGYYYHGAAGAYAAGYIILVIVHFIWIFVFGSEPHSYFGKFGQQSYNSVQQHPSAGAALGAGAAGAAVTQSTNNINAPNETIQDKTAFDEGTPADATAATTQQSPVTNDAPVSEIIYTERVEALHDYHANPEDPSELSFERGDILEIQDRRGNWWQARKADGSTGIIPSNYFA
ncbi:hypothetical protein BC941DRAFT_424386 [Chlamydoabsidia padenii]|nr:hypothetical protein BC941DRAFT_424386 [Chlamydoabsidia padenii]